MVWGVAPVVAAMKKMEATLDVLGQSAIVHEVN
jgi:hypothetical protein